MTHLGVKGDDIKHVAEGTVQVHLTQVGGGGDVVSD